MIFFFDWSTDSLVYPGLDGRPTRISVADLQELGWSFNAADARKTLPRADKSLLSAASALPKVPR